MAFYFEVTDVKTGDLLGGGAVPDQRPDFSRVDHEAIFARVSREWQKHHPRKEIHVEEITAEKYGPLYVGMDQYNTRD